MPRLIAMVQDTMTANLEWQTDPIEPALTAGAVNYHRHRLGADETSSTACIISVRVAGSNEVKAGVPSSRF